MGYFAALYRKVTAEVKLKIEQKYFDDNERMEKLDVIFANRYLAAYSNYRDGKSVTHSWHVAFEAAGEWRPIVLQHLLVGMNAHINLDLGIAAAEVAPSKSAYDSLKDDFNRINTILANLVNGVKDELAQIWPTLRLINFVAGGAEDAIINFSMEIARDGARGFGEELAPLDSEARKLHIRRRDDEIAALGELVAHPPLLTSIVLLLVRVGERGNTAQRLIQENRRQMGQRSPVLQDCLVTRREAYEVVALLVSTDKVRMPSTGRLRTPLRM